MSVVTEIRHTITCDKCGVTKVEWTVPEKDRYAWGREIPTANLPALWFKHENALYCDKHLLAVIEA